MKGEDKRDRWVKWLGHAAFHIRIDDVNLVFDPWIHGNPSAPIENYRELKSADLVLVSHDHRDHGLVDGARISRSTGAPLVAVFELANRAKDQGAENILPGNVGGIIKHDGMEIMFTKAYHSCGVGTPCGFMVKVKDTVVYHAGDTSLFMDMELYGQRWDVDLALLPIGSTYTMDPYDAARAVSFLNPKVAVPMHYNTFPAVKQDPGEFRKWIKKMELDTQVMILEPGLDVRF